jgi:small conductance mechanosensitive channel
MPRPGVRLARRIRMMFLVAPGRCLRLIAATLSLLWLGACGSATSTKLGSSSGFDSSQQPPPIEVAQAPGDGEIQDRLVRIFGQLEGLEDVRVRVREGVVQLGGTTASASLERQAVDVATRVRGVVQVNDEIVQPRGGWGVLSPLRGMLLRAGRGTLQVLPRLGAGVIVFLPFALLSLLLRRWRHPLRLFGVSALSGGIVRAGLRVLTIVLGIVLALDVIGIIGIVGAVFGALGLLGIVSGFVFKDWVANYLPAVALGLHPPFKAGDLIQLGPHEGRVVRITPRATVLMTSDGEEVRLPNALSLREPMINYSHHGKRRLRFTVPFAPYADLRLAHDVGRRTLLAIRGIVAEPPPFMRTRALEHDRIEVEFFAWVDQSKVNFRTAESNAKRAVFEALAEHHVPLPVETLLIDRPPKPQAVAHEGAAPPDAAEELDRVFLDQQLQAARADPRERDLLEEGSSHRRAPDA